MTENDVATHIVDACYQIHVKLGPGLLESVYVRILEYELGKRGLRVRREVPISFRYDDLEFDEGFRADLVVEDKVIVELKSVEQTHPVYKKRSLALGEFSLGIEAMQRFVRREPLRRVHECVFGVLALESEPVDPRL